MDCWGGVDGWGTCALQMLGDGGASGCPLIRPAGTFSPEGEKAVGARRGHDGLRRCSDAIHASPKAAEGRRTRAPEKALE